MALADWPAASGHGCLQKTRLCPQLRGIALPLWAFLPDFLDDDKQKSSGESEQNPSV
jgi:hypothetical protein